MGCHCISLGELSAEKFSVVPPCATFANTLHLVGCVIRRGWLFSAFSMELVLLGEDLYGSWVWVDDSREEWENGTWILVPYPYRDAWFLHSGV